MGARPLIRVLNDPRVMLVPLSQGRFAVIDAADAGRVGQHTWTLTVMGTNEYAYTTRRTNAGRQPVLLHRFILGLPPRRPLVDHRNRDGLDCRRANLRVATRTQNNINKATKGGGGTGFRGIERTGSGKWHARITVARKRINLGVYADPADAARAYDAAATRLFGEFAVLNFPEERG